MNINIVIFISTFIYLIDCKFLNNKDFDRDYDRFSESHKRRKRDIETKLNVPRIVTDLPLLTKFRMDSFRLHCGVEGNPTPVIKWYSNSVNSNRYNGFIQINDNDAYSANRGELQISNASPKMNANYYCNATNVFGTVLSRKSEVQKIFQSSDISVTYDTSDIKKNGKAVIECIVRPDILTGDYIVKEWIVRIKDEPALVLTRTEGRYSVINTTKVPQLHIRNVTKYDFDYLQVQCVLQNKFLPEIIIRSQQWMRPREYPFLYFQQNFKFDKCKGYEIFVARKSTIELPWCSHPTAQKITWFKSNSSSTSYSQPINLNSWKYKLVSDQFDNLIIHNVDVSDEGYYFVKKDNKLLVDYSPFQIRVIDKIRISILEQNRFVSYGQPVEFTCVVFGYPITDVFWLHNGVNVKTMPSTSTDPTTILSTLRIDKVTLDTDGVYQCVAESGNNSDNRIFDFAQLAVSVTITEMSPRLIGQVPAVPDGEQYATTVLDDTNKIVTIQCSFNAIPNATIQWFLDDTPILIDTVIPIKITTQEPYTKIVTLQINLNELNSIGDTWQYGGMYVAKATNNIGSADCKTLVFVEKVFMIREQKTITLKHGQQWTLKCYVISASRPEITWFKLKDGKRTKFPETHLEIENRDRREIFIKQVVKGIHDASYECNALLGTSRIVKTFNVVVIMPPLEITSSFADVLSIDSRSANILMCQPKPILDLPWYTWWEFTPFHTDVTNPAAKVLSDKESISGLEVSRRPQSDSQGNYPPLPEGVPTFLRSLPNTFCKLSITFDKQLHMSNLTCVVQNHAGIIRRTFRITLSVIEFNVQPPPELNVTLGGSFTLNCSAKPNQLETTIIWSRDSVEVPLYHLNILSSIYRFTNGTLVVRNMTDSGTTHKFMCMINSSSTQPISKVVNILLQVPARILPMSDSFDIVTKSDFDLKCQIYGDDHNLEMKWQQYSNGYWMESRNVQRGITSSSKITPWILQFRNTASKDAGRYRCVARNAYSKHDVEKVVNVEVVAVPGPIVFQNDRTIIDARSVTMEWQEPLDKGNKMIIDYMVTWRCGRGLIERNVTKKQITIEKLRPNTVYNITVRARNQVGLGEQVSQEHRTKQAIPEGPVLNLTAVVKSSTHLVLSWRPPDPQLQNGRILKYQLCHHRLSTAEFANVIFGKLSWAVAAEKPENKKSMSICEFVNETQRSFNSMPKFTGYAFRVRPVNEIGPGPISYGKERTLEDLPEKAPINVTSTGTSPTSINLQWNPPPQDAINGVVQGYKVTYFRPEHYGTEKDGVISVSETRLSLERLLPYSNYSIQVAVMNRKGVGPFSAPLICTTNQDISSPPKVVKVFPYSDTCLYVVWSPPAASNGPLLQYCITVKHTNRHMCQQAEPKKEYYTHKVCDLSPAVEYVVEVEAQNNYKQPSKPATSARVQTKRGRDVIVSIPHDIVVTDGATVTLDCETLYGNTSPTWKHYQSPRTAPIQMHYQEPNGTLIITNSSKATNGTYECSLQGSESINYHVTVRVVTNGIPQRPEIYYHSSSTHSVLISWRCAGSPRPNDPITSFYIAMYTNKDIVYAKHEVSATKSTYTITNLSCGTSYKLQLTASNRAGLSDPGIVDVRTVGTEPLWVNSSQLLSSRHTHSLCFRLREFLPGQGCVADRFEISLDPSTGKNYSFSRAQVHEQCNNVTDLNPDTNYSYTVYAVNNAGHTFNRGRASTLQLPSSTPTTTKVHKDSIINLLYDPKFYIIFAVVIVSILLAVALGCYCVRQNFANQMQPPQKVNNILQPFPVLTSPIITATPSMTHRNRRLPDVPCNTYDSGLPSVSKNNNDDDDDMKPYATYAPLHQESLPPNSRVSQGQKGGMINDQTAYNAGSQAHSYQYPDMVNSSQQAPTMTMDIHVNATVPIESYDNHAKQTMIHGRQVYSKGYSVGGDARCPLLPQRPSDSMCQEPYRPGGSTWSNTTGSSTKELTQLFHHNYGGDHTSGLREQDEDNCSTIRPMNHSSSTAMALRMMPNDDLQESYFESSSSCDDPGIRVFTQERIPGQAIEQPRFTSHVAPTFVRQSSSASSTYDTVDAPLHRRSIPFNDPSTNRFVRQETLPEEEESSNYQNKFVIV